MQVARDVRVFFSFNEISFALLLCYLLVLLYVLIEMDNKFYDVSD